MAKNECPHPNCSKRKSRELYACYDHWRTLPVKVKNKIYRGYVNEDTRLWLEGDKEAVEFWKANV